MYHSTHLTMPQTHPRNPQTSKKVVKPQPKPKATHNKGAWKTKTSATIPDASNVLQSFENGTQETVLQFATVASESFIQRCIQTSCIIDIIVKGSSQQPVTPQPSCQNPQSAGPSWTGQQVAFDLTPGPAPGPLSTNTLTPNQHASLWLQSPSDNHQMQTVNPFLSAAGETPSPPSPENFGYVFQSPLMPLRPLGSLRCARASYSSRPPSPTTPHCNHGHSPPQAEPHSTWPQLPFTGPAGNWHGKYAKDLDPFFEDDQSGDRQVCILCQ